MATKKSTFKDLNVITITEAKKVIPTLTDKQLDAFIAKCERFSELLYNEKSNRDFAKTLEEERDAAAEFIEDLNDEENDEV